MNLFLTEQEPRRLDSRQQNFMCQFCKICKIENWNAELFKKIAGSTFNIFAKSVKQMELSRKVGKLGSNEHQESKILYISKRYL